MRKNINEAYFKERILFDKLVFITEDRIDRRNLPENVYIYETRFEAGGENDTRPVEIAHNIAVDFCCTVLSNAPLNINLNENYVTIEPGDFRQRNEYDESYGFDGIYIQNYLNNSPWDAYVWEAPSDRVVPYVVAPIKLFISQPFTGYDDKEIDKQRRLLHELYAKYIGRNITDVILLEQHDVDDKYDTSINFCNDGQRDFYRFCRSVGIMAKSDVVLFYGDWQKSKGASLEHDIVTSYGMNHVEQDELIEFCMNHPELDDDYFMPLWKKQFFDIHEIADVNIFRDPKGGFKATAELNCNGYTAIGDTPNDAYIALYSKLDDVAHDIMTKQIDSLKNSNVTVAICDDAETVTDEELINMHKDYIGARDEGTPVSESEIVLPDIDKFYITDYSRLISEDIKKYPLFIHDENNSNDLIINHEILSKFMYEIKKPLKIEVSLGAGDHSGAFDTFKASELCVHVGGTTLTCTKKVKSDPTSVIEIRSEDVNSLKFVHVKIWAK